MSACWLCCIYQIVSLVQTSGEVANAYGTNLTTLPQLCHLLLCQLHTYRHAVGSHAIRAHVVGGHATVLGHGLLRHQSLSLLLGE